MWEYFIDEDALQTLTISFTL